MVDSRAGPDSAALLHQIWDAADLPFRAGLAFWRPYERLSAPRQEAMLHGAATAVQLAMGGTITQLGCCRCFRRASSSLDNEGDRRERQHRGKVVPQRLGLRREDRRGHPLQVRAR
jgi:hypothetical protein